MARPHGRHVDRRHGTAQAFEVVAAIEMLVGDVVEDQLITIEYGCGSDTLLLWLLIYRRLTLLLLCPCFRASLSMLHVMYVRWVRLDLTWIVHMRCVQLLEVRTVRVMCWQRLLME